MTTTNDPSAEVTSGGGPPTEPVDEQNSLFADLLENPETADETSVPSAQAPQLDQVLDIPVRLSVELGRAEIPIRDIVNLGRGSIIELDGSPGEPLDVRVNGVMIGRGEIVVINEERLGLRFIEVVSRGARSTRP